MALMPLIHAAGHNNMIGKLNLQHWIDENRHLLKPPVGNRELYTESGDFIVMVVGGPNSRTDFHINHGEELFYQLEGEVTIKTVQEGEHVDVKLGPGDMMLLPGGIPHSPRRPAGTIGLVVERKRQTGEQDGFRWYCEHCGHVLHEARAHVADIVEQLPKIMATFKAPGPHRTCQNCGRETAQ